MDASTRTDTIARLERDRVFVQSLIYENVRRLSRIEEKLHDLVAEAHDVAEVRELAGGPVRLKEDE
jgi:hypothetical protein